MHTMVMISKTSTRTDARATTPINRLNFCSSKSEMETMIMLNDE